MTQWDEGHRACYDEFMRRINAIKNDIWMASFKYKENDDYGMIISVSSIIDIFDKYIPKEN